MTHGACVVCGGLCRQGDLLIGQVLADEFNGINMEGVHSNLTVGPLPLVTRAVNVEFNSVALWISKIESLGN